MANSIQIRLSLSAAIFATIRCNYLAHTMTAAHTILFTLFSWRAKEVARLHKLHRYHGDRRRRLVSVRLNSGSREETMMKVKRKVFLIPSVAARAATDWRILRKPEEVMNYEMAEERDWSSLLVALGAREAEGNGNGNGASSSSIRSATPDGSHFGWFGQLTTLAGWPAGQ